MRGRIVLKICLYGKQDDKSASHQFYSSITFTILSEYDHFQSIFHNTLIRISNHACFQILLNLYCCFYHAIDISVT